MARMHRGGQAEDWDELPPERQAELARLQAEAPVVDCWVSEFAADTGDITSIRTERLRGVSFTYNYPEEIRWEIKKQKPKHIFVMGHGWQNNILGSLEFSSRLVRGILARAEHDGLTADQLAFVLISWESVRINFMESAATAETIGCDRRGQEVSASLRHVRSQRTLEGRTPYPRKQPEPPQDATAHTGSASGHWAT